MHFLLNYGLFLAKLASVAIGILLVLAGIISITSKGKTKQQGKLSVKHLNETYQQNTEIMLTTVANKQDIKAFKKAQKSKSNKKNNTKKRLFVLNFDGDIRASTLGSLRAEITAILLIAVPEQDEVLVRLDSSGGLVNAYGLAASQLDRIKAANIRITVAIDKVAASGGYMMACVADHIVAAPFAIIGSIGVIAQLPNFHELLKKKHVDFEQITAGEYKRTLTVLGKNTDKGRQKMQVEVDETHALFKEHIHRHRPQVFIDEVATGEHWYATQARNFKLVDELNTSDDFLLSRSKTMELFEVKYTTKKTLSQKLVNNTTTLWQQLFASNNIET